MKKTKLLTPIITIAGLTTIATPLITLTGCAKSSVGNLMEEYTPTIGQRIRESFASTDNVVDTYLNVVKENGEVFIQDMIYTLSRGLPQYVSYISEYCEIKDHNFDMQIDPASIEVVNTDEARTITFTATFKIVFDYTGTKREEMEWYDLPYYRWNTETKAKFVLDFDTRSFTEITPYAQRKQLTTLAGATQLGVSELNSTVQLVSEKGTCVDLDGIKHKIDTNEASINYHFMLPDEGYWDDDPEGRQKIYGEVNDLWFDHPGLQLLILVFKYYMSGVSQAISGVPSTFDFGSYYLGQATLDDLWTCLPEGANLARLFGFNLSLDSINNNKNIEKQLGGTFALPTKVSIGGVERKIQYVNSNAFDGAQSTFTNYGIPTNVTTLTIPQEYKAIGQRAFAGNTRIQKIEFTKPLDGEYPEINLGAFASLNSLSVIDLSQYENSQISTISDGKFKHCFDDVHLGNPAPSDGIEGHIWLPSSWDDVSTKDYWSQFITNSGLPIYQEEGGQVIKTGWVLETAPSQN